MPQGNAQSIDSVNAKLKFTSNAQAIDSVNAEFEILSQGFILLTPEAGEINVTLQPTFSWQDPENRGLYRLVYSLNQDYSNSTKIWTTGTSYTPPSNLTSGTYYWKVEAQALSDRPPIVPDEEVFSGMALWNDVLDPAPIYVYDQAAPMVVEGANDLSNYIGQSSGKTAPSVTAVSDSFSFPSRCIKVGFPNNLTEREQIHIKCSDGGPIELTGKDVFDPQNPTWIGQENEDNYMNEAGSYHAVMTFLHDYVGVVWGWMGSLGEAVPNRAELSISAMDMTHTPSCMARNHLRFSDPGNSSNYGISKRLMKRRRTFYSLQLNTGHEMRNIYQRFHPDFNTDMTENWMFALQPDGSRDGYPDGPGASDPKRLAKVEVGDDRFPQFFFDNFVEFGLAKNPLREAFGCGMNDSGQRGHSVDDRAAAMDYPDRGRALSGSTTEITVDQALKTFEVDEHVGTPVKILEGTNSNEADRTVVSNTIDTLVVDPPYPVDIDSTSFYELQEPDVIDYNFIYRNSGITAPTITDRETEFANRIVARVRQTYPNFYVNTSAYAPTRIPGREVVADDGVLIVNVSNEFNNPNSWGEGGQTHAKNFDDSLILNPNQVWRPNIGTGSGHQAGLWLCQVHRVGSRFKELVNAGVTGFLPDNFWEHHSTQWPMYYLMSELMWDHTQDIDVIMDKAYNTLFGDAAIHVKAYYEAAENQLDANLAHNVAIRFIPDIWNTSVLNTMQTHLTNAINSVTEGSEEHDRILWIQAGFNYGERYIEACKYWIAYNEPATVTDQTDLATESNAIESDVDSSVGWGTIYGGTPAIVVQSDEVDVEQFAFFLDSGIQDGGSRGYSMDNPLPGTGADMYLATFRVKHSGVGGDWFFDRFGSSEQRVRVFTQETQWRDLKFVCYGGETIRVREGNDEGDGSIYIESFTLQAAEPVDQSAIKTEWNAYNLQTMENILDPQYRGTDYTDDHYPPIGEAIAYRDGDGELVNRRLPTSNTPASNIPDPGFE